MSAWIKQPMVLDGEIVVWTKGASHPQRRRLVGGRLFLTNHRLIFQPNRLEAATGAKPWSVALHEITALGPEPWFRSWLRPRLRIDLEQRSPERFWVSQLDPTGVQMVELVNRLR